MSGGIEQAKLIDGGLFLLRVMYKLTYIICTALCPDLAVVAA